MMPALTSSIVGHGLAAVVFGGLAVWFLAGWRRGALGVWLVVACATSAAWATAVVLVDWWGGHALLLARFLETVRSCLWVAFMAGALALGPQGKSPVGAGRMLSAVIALAGLALFAADALVFTAGVADAPPRLIRLALVGRLALAVVGLAVVENFFRNTSPERRWSVKYFCLGVAGIFAFDLVLYSEALLYGRPSEDLLAARGFVNILVAPLLVVASTRNPDWSLEVFISRKAVLHSATLVLAGIFLIFMAGAGFYLREYAGTWGGVAQVTVLFGGALFLGTALVSGRLRSSLAVWVSKHFFTYKYDYREEWLRFIGTITSRDQADPLYQRAIQAVADIVDSPDGGLWARGNEGDFALVRDWNRRIEPTLTEPRDGALARLLSERSWVVNLGEESKSESPDGDYPLPEWLRGLDWAWLVVPMIHRKELVAFAVLGHSRAARTVNWEDFDLLKIVGSQIASYLVEQEVLRALQEARQFEMFNRRFAFVLHDIKNLVSQLSLLVANADRFADNPEFQRDMVDTVRGSVDKMKGLLAKLHQGRDDDRPADTDLAEVLRQLVHGMREMKPQPRLDVRADSVTARIVEDGLVTALTHLVANAVEASGVSGQVVVRLDREEAYAVIDVVDNGAGMDLAFVQNELFRPFRSSKPGGYGIGMYESRQLVERMGGRLTVTSRPGEGTTVRVALPLSGRPAGQGSNTLLGTG